MHVPALPDGTPAEYQGAYNTGIKGVEMTWQRRQGAMLRAQNRTRARNKRTPSNAQIERWLVTGVARATDGCQVEVDGVCPHGRESWLLVLGMV